MIDDNDYFELSLSEKKELKNEIFHELQQLVINICAERADLVDSIDYNDFGIIVQGYLKQAAKKIDCAHLCGYAWGANDFDE